MSIGKIAQVGKLDSGTIRCALLQAHHIRVAGLWDEFRRYLDGMRRDTRDQKLSSSTGSDLLAAMETADELADLLRIDRAVTEKIARDELLGGEVGLVLRCLRRFFRTRVESQPFDDRKTRPAIHREPAGRRSA